MISNFFNRVSLFKLITFVLMISVSRLSLADSFTAAVDEYQIQLNATIDSETVVPNQQVQVNVEALSLVPFDQDMELGYVDVAQMIVVKDEQPISRSVKTIDGQKWYAQTTRLYLYPTQAKQYNVPALDAKVALASSNEQVISGSIQSKPIQLEVQGVSGIQEQTPLVVGSEASLSVSNNRDFDTPLSVGEAVTFTYTMEVKGSNTIILPTLNIADIDGTKMYRKPASKENVLNPLSKTNTAVLKQNITVIAQSGGEFELPAIELAWWDTTQNTLRRLSTDTQVIAVTGEPSLPRFDPANFDNFESISQWLKSHVSSVLLVVMLVTLSLWAELRYKKVLGFGIRFQQWRKQQRQHQHFLSLVESRQYANAVDAFYGILEKQTNTTNDTQLSLTEPAQRLWNKLLNAAYSSQTGQEFSLSEAKDLLNGTQRKRSGDKQGRSFNLQLNG